MSIPTTSMHAFITFLPTSIMPTLALTMLMFTLIKIMPTFTSIPALILCTFATIITTPTFIKFAPLLTTLSLTTSAPTSRNLKLYLLVKKIMQKVTFNFHIVAGLYLIHGFLIGKCP